MAFIRNIFLIPADSFVPIHSTREEERKPIFSIRRLPYAMRRKRFVRASCSHRQLAGSVALKQQQSTRKKQECCTVWCGWLTRPTRFIRVSTHLRSSTSNTDRGSRDYTNFGVRRTVFATSPNARSRRRGAYAVSRREANQSDNQT